ncbi:MAG: DEAD/DEAH box helicase, partial [Desulfurococcales archaeon]|nr:DEAD/DEAH box helicase [Desulfurococcales archaeon]
MSRGMPRAVEELDPRLVELIRRRGWSGLTVVQEKAIPVILDGANAILVAPTGEGKTEAALLPILSMMAREGAEPVSLLYITPMKALINDLYLRISWWASRLGFRVARKHGDTSASERSRRLRNVPHILVTTPESLEIDLDWSRRFRVYYRNLRWVIIDEVHELLSNKRGAQFIIQLERLARIAGRDIQRIGLSATIGDLDRALELLSGSSSRRRVIVDGRRVKKPKLSVTYVRDDSSDPWLDVAGKVLQEVEKPSLVFVNSRYVAEKLKDSLERLARIAGRDIQRIGLSATIGDLDRALELLSGSSSRRRVIVDGRRVKKPRLSVAYVKDDSSDPWLDVAARVLREVEKPSLV